MTCYLIFGFRVCHVATGRFWNLASPHVRRFTWTPELLWQNRVRALVRLLCLICCAASVSAASALRTFWMRACAAVRTHHLTRNGLRLPCTGFCTRIMSWFSPANSSGQSSASTQNSYSTQPATRYPTTQSSTMYDITPQHPPCMHVYTCMHGLRPDESTGYTAAFARLVILLHGIV